MKNAIEKKKKQAERLEEQYFKLEVSMTDKVNSLRKNTVLFFFLITIPASFLVDFDLSISLSLNY